MTLIIRQVRQTVTKERATLPPGALRGTGLLPPPRARPQSLQHRATAAYREKRCRSLALRHCTAPSFRTYLQHLLDLLNNLC